MPPFLVSCFRRSGVKTRRISKGAPSWLGLWDGFPTESAPWNSSEMVNRTRGVLGGPTWSIYRFPVSLCSSRQHDSPGSPRLSHSREHRTCLGTSRGTVGSKSSTVPTLSSKGLYNDSGLLPKIKKKKEKWIYFQRKIGNLLLHFSSSLLSLCLYDK